MGEIAAIPLSPVGPARVEARDEQATFEVLYLYVMLVVAPFGFTVELSVALVMSRLDADWAVILGFVDDVVKDNTDPYAFPYEFSAMAQK